MKMTIEMPVVESCTISECGYNKNSQCHARAITIGDGVHPGCDTSFLGAPISANGNDMAGVGACKVTSCSFNEELECNAEQITVSMNKGNIQCATFQLR